MVATEHPWSRCYDPGVPSDLQLEDLTLPAFLERAAERYPHRPALIFMNRTLTYVDLRNEVGRFAAALVELGVEKNSRVAIQLPNLPQTVIAFLATLSLGAQAVMTNPMYTQRELRHQWSDAGCTVAVVADFLFDRTIRPIRDQLPVEHYVVTAIADYLRFPLSLLAPLKLKRAGLTARIQTSASIHRMVTLIHHSRPMSVSTSPSLDDVALLQYTGGTTGVAKGAMLTHRNLSSNVQQIASWFPNLVRGHEVVLACLPFFHVFGLTVSLGFPILTGSSIVLIVDPRDSRLMARFLAKHRVTVFPGVPAMFDAIASSNRRADVSAVKVCVSGSAPLPSRVAEKFEQMTGSQIVEGFGLTEASPVTHCTPLEGKNKRGSIGLPLPGTDARVVDLDDWRSEAPVGEPGELVIRGPQVMRGYWKRPDETAVAITGDGWLRTGDIAIMDEDGFFQIVGRKKDMILVNGYKVYPDEVDDVLLSHPAVLESGTVGVPDDRQGERVKSFVVVKAAVSEDELVAHCRSQLAAYKVPCEIEFREELPKNAVLKILRRELRGGVGGGE